MFPSIDRREFLDWGVHGLGATALLSLLQRDGVVAAEKRDGRNGAAVPNFPPRAKRVFLSR